MIAPTIYQTKIFRPLPDKEIFWSGARAQTDDVDLRRFPYIRDIQSCPRPPKGKPLAEFVAEVRGAQGRVFILDDFLFNEDDAANPMERVEHILAWFPNGFSAPDVRLLTTSRSKGVDRQISERIADHEKAINQNPYVKISIIESHNLREFAL